MPVLYGCCLLEVQETLDWTHNALKQTYIHVYVPLSGHRIETILKFSIMIVV